MTIGRPDIADEPKYADMRTRGRNAPELIAILDQAFAAKTRQEWMNALKEGGDFIYTVVNRVADLPDDPQVQANEYIVHHEVPGLGQMQMLGMPVKLSETPGDPRGHAPELGEQTETILTEMLGYTWDDIARLRELNVI